MCVCCICRELREKIQPEIMELIKQQRLNRLCEGTCFRKISSRRRQGEKHKCTRSIWAWHDHNHVHAASTQALVLFLSPSLSVCLFSIPPLHTPTHYLIPFAVWKPHRRYFITGDPRNGGQLRFGCHEFSSSLSLWGRDTQRQAVSVIQEQACLSVLRCTITLSPLLLPLHTQVHGNTKKKKYNNTKPREATMHIYTLHLSRQIQEKALRKEKKEVAKHDPALQHGGCESDNLWHSRHQGL